ncbi:methionine/alanine import family NSS transporter small subunit [Nocardioides dilutus]
MTTSAIVMMLVAMAVVWGGLALAIRSLNRTTREEPDEVHRDL